MKSFKKILVLTSLFIPLIALGENKPITVKLKTGKTFGDYGINKVKLHGSCPSGYFNQKHVDQESEGNLQSKTQTTLKITHNYRTTAEKYKLILSKGGKDYSCGEHKVSSGKYSPQSPRSIKAVEITRLNLSANKASCRWHYVYN